MGPIELTILVVLFLFLFGYRRISYAGRNLGKAWEWLRQDGGQEET